MLNVNDLKTGTYFVFKDDPYIVIKHDFIKVAQSKGMMRASIKNLKTGKIFEETFKGQEKLEQADISRSKANYLYQEDVNYYFMDSSTYDQFFVTKEQLGDKVNYLKENLEVEVLNFNNEPIGVELPKKIKLKVTLAPPGIRGDTAQGSVTKKVTLDTGQIIDAPLFIKQDEEVIVNTETGKYVSKA